MPASTIAHDSKTKERWLDLALSAKFLIYNFVFPQIEPLKIHMLASSLGDFIVDKREAYFADRYDPSSVDIQILNDLLIDNHPVIQSLRISVSEAFGLLTIFEMDNENYVTTEAAYWSLKNADAIEAKIDRPRNASNAGRASGESRRMANLERNQDICQAATQLLNQGKYARDIVGILKRRFPELKSRKTFGDILKNNCPAWPRYKKRNLN